MAVRRHPGVDREPLGRGAHGDFEREMLAHGGRGRRAVQEGMRRRLQLLGGAARQLAGERGRSREREH